MPLPAVATAVSCREDSGSLRTVYGRFPWVVIILVTVLSRWRCIHFNHSSIPKTLKSLLGTQDSPSKSLPSLVYELKSMLHRFPQILTPGAGTEAPAGLVENTRADFGVGPRPARVFTSPLPPPVGCCWAFWAETHRASYTAAPAVRRGAAAHGAARPQQPPRLHVLKAPFYQCGFRQGT